MWRITDQLYLGQASDAQDAGALRAAGVTHILNCATELPCYHPREFAYLHLAFKDPDPSFSSKILQACEFLDCASRSGIALVHCQGAVSRSPAMVLAYLCHNGQSLQQAASHLSRIVATKPNPMFLQAVSEHYEATLSGSRLAELDRQLTAGGSGNVPS